MYSSVKIQSQIYEIFNSLKIGILRLDSKLIDLCDISDSRDIAPLIAQIAGEELERNKETSLIVDDKSITNIFKSSDNIKHFKTVSLKCATVIACRLSPIQKSQIVRLVKGKP